MRWFHQLAATSTRRRIEIVALSRKNSIFVFRGFFLRVRIRVLQGFCMMSLLHISSSTLWKILIILIIIHLEKKKKEGLNQARGWRMPHAQPLTSHHGRRIISLPPINLAPPLYLTLLLFFFSSSVLGILLSRAASSPLLENYMITYSY